MGVEVAFELGAYYRTPRGRVICFVGEATDGEYFDPDNNSNELVFEEIGDPHAPDLTYFQADAKLHLTQLNEMEVIAWMSK